MKVPRQPRLRMLIVPMVLAVGVLQAPAARAHEERPVRFPPGNGEVPEYRTTGPYLVVCRPDTSERIRTYPEELRLINERLLAECRFRSIQRAVDAVRRRGTRILVQPGVYLEPGSLARPTEACAGFYERAEDGDDGNDVMSYRQQRRCPHAQNLVAVFGDGPDRNRRCDGRLCDLQIEGTGLRPRDVVIDGRFRKLNVIRADRADGVYFRNFTVQQATFNSLYVLETDGFVIDRMVGRWNDEYGFLTFASDHGLYRDCEAYGNGDGGLYPGSAADHHGSRPAIEIARCRAHHNLLGYSGTAGNSVFVHDSDFYANATGVVMDSFFPDHPGLPQDSAVFIRNRIHGSNSNYYENWRGEDAPCRNPPEARKRYREGLVCPAVQVPVGTGVLVAGGNANLFARNWIYDNWRYGTMQFWVPAAVRNDPDPRNQYDTSHFNRYVGNRMGLSPSGRVLPNGLDFWWDEEGAGNCWERNAAGPGGITSDPNDLPECGGTPLFTPGNPGKQALLVPCATWSRENTHPPGCDWMDRPPRP